MRWGSVCRTPATPQLSTHLKGRDVCPGRDHVRAVDINVYLDICMRICVGNDIGFYKIRENQNYAGSFSNIFMMPAVTNFYYAAI